MNSEQLSQYLSVLGAITEICGIFYKNLIKQGFTKTQALQLTQTYMAITFTSKND